VSGPLAPPRPPWRGSPGAAAPAAAPRPTPGGDPARRLLREHLAHGGRARREAAAFALALSRPAAAEAIAAFFSRRKESPR
jgi:hypothetical protein